MKKARFFISSGMSLARLRLAFMALGAVLLVGLGSLSLAVQERLKEAELERKEMVALRAFDELEREVSAFLDIENEREPYRNLRGSDPAAWAPFVIGYFRSVSGRDETVAADGKTSENQRRLTWALDTVKPRFGEKERSEGDASPGAQPEEVQAIAPKPVLNPAQSESHWAAPPPSPSKGNQEAAPLQERTGSNIISQLNRAPQRRKAAKQKSPSAEQKQEDQFLDYEQRF